jgi:hypothetical protein
LWKAAEEMIGSKGKRKKWSLNLYPIVCVMLVCCAEDKGEEQLAAWTLFLGENNGLYVVVVKPIASVVELEE